MLEMIYWILEWLRATSTVWEIPNWTIIFFWKIPRIQSIPITIKSTKEKEEK